MRILKLLPIIGPVLLFYCSQPKPVVSEFVAVSQVDSGKPMNVMMTAYSTTLIANGKDQASIRIAVVDSLDREITSASDSIKIYVKGDGKVTFPDGRLLPTGTDTAGKQYSICKLMDGTCKLIFTSGTKPDKVKIEAIVPKLWPGGHEIHTIPANLVYMTPKPEQLPATKKSIDRMIGADISFLPQLEARGIKFSENGLEKDGVLLLKEHGFNYIRLRVFVNPENEKGYSPKEGYCDLKHTLAIAKRVKDAGLKILLDYHYSDYWADPQQQNKPLAWQNLDFKTLKDSVKAHTIKVLRALKAQGTLPDMVQVGNEINHGMIWPDGHISNLDQLAELIKSGIEGVNAVDPNIPIMEHLALGGQNKEAVFWLDNMIGRGVKFDIIGLSYYPRWHGTLDDLKFNLNDLIKRYNKPVNVVEYSNFKKEVHDIVFHLPNNMGKGAAIWEPLSWNTNMVKGKGEITDVIKIYDALKSEYLGSTNQ
jgi:arabinogalactan endo-1,4-beta-galactosidase